MSSGTVSNSKRVLTMKSKLGFGKYGDSIIESIIKLEKHGYLRWVYFNYSGIDFMPEILDIIQIPLEYRLVKPAKNSELLEFVNAQAIDKHRYVYDMSDDAVEKRNKAHNTIKSKKYTVESKAALLRKNHGHK
ncbi:MAG: hypothetical protein RLZZ546_762 [Bacteroidota bacterium]|jgi:hypothetical protein